MINLHGNPRTLHVITDDISPPLPIPTLHTSFSSSSTSAFPTEARIRQKDRLKKLKEAGLKPKKKKIYTEPGDDDCGNDLSGLGPDAVLYSCDVQLEAIDSSDEDDMFITIPLTIRESTTNVYSAVAHLCYGNNNRVDLLELCGGEGRISTIAFRRGLLSGGNLDLTTGCDLGDPNTQKALNHYLDTCSVMVTVLQPNCRSVGSFAPYNSMMHYSTWNRHHQEDLPHLKYCGQIALKQMELGRYFLREQPAGTQLDHIAPWPEVQSHESVMTQLMDQCMAGAQDDQGRPVQKTTEWTSNSPVLLRPFQQFNCNQSHVHWKR